MHKPVAQLFLCDSTMPAPSFDTWQSSNGMFAHSSLRQMASASWTYTPSRNTTLPSSVLANSTSASSSRFRSSASCRLSVASVDLPHGHKRKDSFGGTEPYSFFFFIPGHKPMTIGAASPTTSHISPSADAPGQFLTTFLTTTLMITYSTIHHPDSPMSCKRLHTASQSQYSTTAKFTSITLTSTRTGACNPTPVCVVNQPIKINAEITKSTLSQYSRRLARLCQAPQSHSADLPTSCGVPFESTLSATTSAPQ